ncbi:LysR family transcriptional regulator [Pelomonas sp. SE-A7]|uniref:LysR family transcriptional regulator n=1 Tax=Pelomonas sp. SE-A7 TaxID=3054953 RepID=UPI00259CA7EB|nr:LysR family transcriptional regulator [Pelomonas sp. SE-A7]MDM4767094.1 LysR family transcriptional regulator [Pelomonas sp. SE-A7]
MLHLDDLALFVRIVELGTLSAAARERQVPVSQVTRSLARLESQCGLRLLHRSTHGLSLTDEGDGVLAHARRLLDSAAELQGELSLKRAGPSGWVRVSASTIVAQAVVVPSLPTLYQRHPQLHLDVSADDRIIDMAREGVDLAIRTGSPASDSLVARRIGELTRRLYAAPAYVAEHGLPASLDELPAHRLLGHSASPLLNRWQLGQGREARLLEIKPHTRTDNSAVMLALALQGVGIARMVSIVAEPLVASGALVPVLPDQAGDAPVPLFAVMQQERHRLPKLRACIDHWAEWLQGRQG